MTIVQGFSVVCNRSMCTAALPVPGATRDEARRAAGELGWSARIFSATELGGGVSRSVADYCPDHPPGRLDLACSAPWTFDALTHCADCPMTNQRAAARTSCECDVIQLAMQQARDTPEGWGP